MMRDVIGGHFSFADKSLIIDEKLKEKGLTNRSTFGTEYLHQTVHCKRLRPCNIGLRSSRCRIAKRRPFKFDSFIHMVIRRKTTNKSQLASFSLSKGLVEIPGTGVRMKNDLNKLNHSNCCQTIKRRKIQLKMAKDLPWSWI